MGGQKMKYDEIDRMEVRWAFEMIPHDPKSTLWYIGYAFGIIKRGLFK